MKENYIIEAALETSEAIIDTVLDNEILKSIPVVNTLIKIVKGTLDIRDRLFIAKISSLLKSIENVPPEFKEKIRRKISDDPKGAQKVGETVVFVIERLTSLDKADIIGKVVLAYLDGHLKPEEF